MNLTTLQKAEIAFAIRQHEEAIREIRKNPKEFIDQLERQVRLFNEAMNGDPLLSLKTYKMIT